MPDKYPGLTRVPRVLVIDWNTLVVEITTDSEAMFAKVDEAERTKHHFMFVHESGSIAEMNIPECWQDE